MRNLHSGNYKKGQPKPPNSGRKAGVQPKTSHYKAKELVRALLAQDIEDSVTTFKALLKDDEIKKEIKLEALWKLLYAFGRLNADDFVNTIESGNYLSTSEQLHLLQENARLREKCGEPPAE